MCKIMEDEKIVYSGLLLVPLTGKLLLKKSWQQRFCCLYKASKCGIERLEIYDNLDDAVTKSGPNRIITLENCIKISKKGQTCFSIITKTATHEYSVSTEQQLNEWIAALQSVCFRDDVSSVMSIVEDNELYSPSSEGVFEVMLHTSDASNRCGLEATYYTLVLTPTAIELRRPIDNKLLLTWPYHLIRRYGHTSGKFTFEAGRLCESGEGHFYLKHSNVLEIFRCLEYKMKTMKKRLNKNAQPSVLECGENQLHAALSMEARTRSPLPPSPTTSTTLHDIEIERLRNNNEQPSTQTTHSDVASNVKKLINNFDDKRKPQRPVKPPRKFLSEICTSEYETVSKYDEVEYRTNAWRVLGTNTISHTESIKEDDQEEYVSWGQSARNKAQQQNQAESTLSQPRKTSKPIVTATNTSPGDDSYDKLNFFGSSSKLNALRSDYKQIAGTTMNRQAPQQAGAMLSCPAFNAYDEVSTDFEGVRLADDSHLGYAIVRKVKEQPEHQYHNDDAYTIISKPKRV